MSTSLGLDDDSGEDGEEEMDILDYPSSHSNSYYIYLDDSAIAMGGGSDFAFYLDEDLMRGTSGESSTFKNAILACSEDFEVLNVQLYALTSTF